MTHRLALPAVLVLALALSACSPASPATTGPASTPTATATGTTTPTTVQNCGRTLTFDRPVERIVSGWTTSTELLLRLGQGSKVVGQYNTSAGTPSAEFTTQEAAVPTLSTEGLTREQLAAADPDLVWADGEYAFDGSTLPTIDELAQQGTQVMVLSGFCGDDATGATVDDVFTDLTTLGTVLGDSTATDEVAASLHARLDAVAQRTAGVPSVPVVFLADYDGVLYAYDGVYSDIARRAGAHNTYAGALPAGKYYSEVSREDVIARDPSTIVLLTAGDADPAAAKAALAELLPTVAAVRDGAVVTLPESDSTNLRGVDGVEELSRALHP